MRNSFFNEAKNDDFSPKKKNDDFSPKKKMMTCTVGNIKNTLFV